MTCSWTSSSASTSEARDRSPSVPSGLLGGRPAPLFSILLSVLLLACSSTPEPPPGPPVRPSREALAAERNSPLRTPTRLVFDWSLTEPDLRVNGRGVARVEPPYRARLDLFTENGETVVRAALVDGDLRLPPGTRQELVPPPALFWGALGVFRPGTEAVLQGGERTDEGVRLLYRLRADEELRIVVADGELLSLERMEEGHVVERVALNRADASGFPREARYRHLAEVRELRLTLTESREVESYPPDIWNPEG